MITRNVVKGKDIAKKRVIIAWRGSWVEFNRTFTRCERCGCIKINGVCKNDDCLYTCICYRCGRVHIKRTDEWINVEYKKGEHNSHSICPNCIKINDPEIYEKIIIEKLKRKNQI